MLLSVDKVREDAFVAHVRYGSLPVHTSGSFHGSLAEAICSTASGIPSPYAGFVEVRYAGVCGGTYSVQQLGEPTAASQVADHLIEVVSALRTRQ
ncbi:hypothetical protein EZ216_02665 [Ramlibacter humi]|uniref:Uncharacterized protein n=2 Tax=Ramlibacter humi TaxID=2530451 RepID=A0A4Z0CAP5_9BURK|nr:hypothetical protein EZ216_02665 [Ramlibacter humi]